MDTNAIVLRYVDERIQRSEDSVITRRDVLEDYQAWSDRRGYQILDDRLFTKRLRYVLDYKFKAMDTKARPEGFTYSVRVWKHVSLRGYVGGAESDRVCNDCERFIGDLRTHSIRVDDCDFDLCLSCYDKHSSFALLAEKKRRRALLERA